MPVYEYRCKECGTAFEIARPMSERSAAQCPECDGPARRVFSPVGVAFKGTGFHNTDYRPRPSEPAETCSAPSKTGGGCTDCPRT